MSAGRRVWLWSASRDLAVFGGSAALSVALVLAGPRLGVGAETPLWAWLLLVVGIDVAHVWSTGFRVYFDAAERARRPALYWGAPLLAYVVGVAAHLVSPGAFWRLLAYLALWHFIRQQVGWMKLYDRRAGASDAERRLDAAAVYAATLGPAVWWHANLPRPFSWFVEGDFIPGLPRAAGDAALSLHAAVLGLWLVATGVRVARGATFQPGKSVLLLATWLTWYGGIVLARSDFTFTVMNVLLHGIPYLALLYPYARTRHAEPDAPYGRLSKVVRLGAAGFLLVLVALAFAEEWLWDRLVWHDHPTVFGAGTPLDPAWLAVLVPLLAVPQATHYILDAFIWRVGKDPELKRRLGWASSP